LVARFSSLIFSFDVRFSFSAAGRLEPGARRYFFQFNEASCVPEHRLPHPNKFVFCFNALAARIPANPVTPVALMFHM